MVISTYIKKSIMNYLSINLNISPIITAVTIRLSRVLTTWLTMLAHIANHALSEHVRVFVTARSPVSCTKCAQRKCSAACPASSYVVQIFTFFQRSKSTRYVRPSRTSYWWHRKISRRFKSLSWIDIEKRSYRIVDQRSRHWQISCISLCCSR